MYIAATNQVVSSALVVERTEDGKEHGVQRLVYYLSAVLSPTKQRYPHYQKLAYAIYMTGKKLPHYFECHSIIVVASAPVSSILNNPNVTGRVSLWGITLGPWEIMYQRQSAIKSQVLPDFIAEWTEAQMLELPDLSNTWTIYVDGSKRVSEVGAGVVLVSPQGGKMRYVLRMRFVNPSNNDAEYEAVLHGMRMAKACGATRIKIHGDSNLIAQQVMKECDMTCANMIAYHAMYDKLEGNFEGCEVTHLGRESNEEADNLANIEATMAVKFFESITCRYGVPNSIITDNGTNFTSGEFQEFAKELGIKIKYALVAHPKSNGQVEKANGLVCAGLKK
jgi:ribonuclease HI